MNPIDELKSQVCMSYSEAAKELLNNKVIRRASWSDGRTLHNLDPLDDVDNIAKRLYNESEDFDGTPYEDLDKVTRKSFKRKSISGLVAIRKKYINSIYLTLGSSEVEWVPAEDDLEATDWIVESK